ncbi:MAG: tetratricopeptide repeat protein [Chloroflexi bacterium]|nr:tetratricopeptide repeat protein [Chloroflexota bacterium]
MLSTQPPITLPAITRPRRRAEILSRTRLLDLLYDLFERKLILVIAPAGYGKTSLLIDFAHQKDVPACWYTIDQHDQDLRRFVAHFNASISRLYPEFGALSNAALEGLNTPAGDIEPLVNTIVNELYEHVDEHFVIVLDDFHVLGGNQAINAFISRFVSRVDENCHLIILTRQKSDIPGLELLLARAQAGGIGIADLAFTSSEIQSLAQKRQHYLSNDQARMLSEQTEGWITGILLPTLLHCQERGEILQGAQSTRTDLADYWGLLLNEQPQDIQDFYLYSSPLNEFNAGLCETVLRPTVYSHDVDWNGLLEAVLQRNLFVLPVGEDAAWLRYHSLFQDYLRARLEREQPGIMKRILRQLVAVYKDRRDWEKAYDTCQRLGDVAATIDVIEQAGPTLLKYGRLDILTNWLDSIPTSLLSSLPGMLSLKGAVALSGDNPRQGLELLSQAEAGFRTSGDRSRLARTLARRSTAYHSLGDYPAALKDAEEALGIAGDDASLLHLKAQVLKARGISLHCLDRSDEGIRNIEDSLALYESLNDIPNIAALYQELGIVYRSTGKMEAARNAYLKSLEYWREEGNYQRLADLLNNLGVFYHHMEEYEQAAATFDEGLKFARLTGFARLEAFILASLGDLYMDLQANEDAERVFEEALVIAQRIENRFLCFYLNYTLACLARAGGDMPRAHYLHSLASNYALSASSLEQGLLALETARWMMAESRFEEAICRLEVSVQHFRKGKLAAEEAQAHLYLAASFLARGDEETALAQLKFVLDATSDTKSHHAFYIASLYAAAVLERARSDPQLGRQATKLLERLHRMESRLPEIRRKLRKSVVEIPAVQPRIVIRSFGMMQVVVGGKTFNSDPWQSRMQRDMFFYLLQHPEGATKETLLSFFWNDAQTIGNQLANVLYKMRRFLGEDVVQYRDGRYYINRALDYEYDVEIFLDHSVRAKKESDRSKRMQAYQEMLRLYQGDYLLEAEGYWAVSEREHLRLLYIEAALNLGEYHLEQGEYSASLEYCWHVLDRDPCREEIYRLAMRISAAMGNRASVAQHYELCKRSLAKKHNVDPSIETRELFQQLMQ